jgi:MbtH protein
MDAPQLDWQDETVKVVVNDEAQYAIWPADRDPPPGWRAIGRQGSKQDCFAYIAEVWRDMRPLSVRTSAGERAAG